MSVHMMNVFQLLLSKYGESMCQIFRKVQVIEIKVTRVRKALTFLIECKRLGMVPSHISDRFRFCVEVTVDNFEKWTKRSQRFLLNFEINAYNKRKTLQALHYRFARIVTCDFIYKLVQDRVGEEITAKLDTNKNFFQIEK